VWDHLLTDLKSLCAQLDQLLAKIQTIGIMPIGTLRNMSLNLKMDVIALLLMVSELIVDRTLSMRECQLRGAT
jgi:hypothetical protein